MRAHHSPPTRANTLASIHRLASAVHPPPPGSTMAAGAAVGTGALAAILDGALLTVRPVLVLVTAIGAGTMVFSLLQRRGLKQELRLARIRSVEAMDLERQRIQRDLHDSAQQRLVSVKIRLGLLADRLPSTSDRAALARLGRELDDALAEIRSVTWGDYSAMLHRLGVPAALRTLAVSTPVPVTVEVDHFARYAPRLERSVYFCCVEGLQNIVKHAGPSAAARIRLAQRRDWLMFDIEDTGHGFDANAIRRGEGFRNIADRVSALGGRVRVESRPGFGTRVRGEIPLIVDEVDGDVLTDQQAAAAAR